MSWSYSGDPEFTSKDWVRFKIGDTDTNDQQLSDEEIAAMLADNPNTYKAAAACCDALASKYARQINKSIGRGFSISYADRMNHYITIAKRLRLQGATRSAVPYAGGIRNSDKDVYQDDSDLVQPYFSRNDGPFDSENDQDETDSV